MLLALVPVKAWDSEKKICISTYALFDTGSTIRPFVLRGWQTAVCQLDFNKGLLLLYALLALTRVYGELDYFLSRVSILTRDIDIANLSVRPSVRP